MQPYSTPALPERLFRLQINTGVEQRAAKIINITKDGYNIHIQAELRKKWV
jgi:hypothetical protein